MAESATPKQGDYDGSITEVEFLMDRIAVATEFAEINFTPACAFAHFAIGIKGLVAYGVTPEAIATALVRVTQGEIGFHAKQRQLVGPDGKPL